MKEFLLWLILFDLIVFIWITDKKLDRIEKQNNDLILKVDSLTRQLK